MNDTTPQRPPDCDRCGKPKSQHNGVQLFCPFYSTYRAPQGPGEPTPDNDCRRYGDGSCAEEGPCMHSWRITRCQHQMDGFCADCFERYVEPLLGPPVPGSEVSQEFIERQLAALRGESTPKERSTT